MFEIVSSLSAKSMHIRRYTAVIMAAIMLVVSFSATMARASVEAGAGSAVAFSQHHNTAPKPCQRAVLPGAPNACPLMAFAINAIPGNDRGYHLPSSEAHALDWTRLSTSLGAQCHGASVYRPPRTIV